MRPSRVFYAAAFFTFVSCVSRIDTFVPPAVTHVALTASDSTLVADGLSTITLTVVATTVGGRPGIDGEPSVNVPVALSATGTSNTFTPPSGVTDTQGHFTSRFTTTSAGDRTITATVGLVVGTLPISVSAAIPSPPATGSSLVAQPLVQVADGLTPILLLIYVADAQGNAVANAPIHFSSPQAGVTFSANGAGGASLTVNTDAQGIATASVASTQATVTEIDAAVGGGQLTASVTFTPGAPSAATSTLVANPNSLSADGVSTVTLTADIRDVYGNSVPGQGITLASSGTAIVFLPNNTPTTNGAGVATVQVTSTKAQTVNFQLTAQAATAASGAVTFTPLSAATLALTANPDTQTADGNATITLTAAIKDVNGNGVPNQLILLSKTGGADAPKAVRGFSNANGLFSTTMTSRARGLNVVRVKSGALANQAAVTFVGRPATCPNTMTYSDETPVLLGLSDPEDLAIADFNNDGKPDVAVADWGVSKIQVFRGDGNGVFQAPTPLSIGTTSFMIAAADFNNDGKMDLVAGSRDTSGVLIALGNGNGTFQAPVTNATASTTRSVLARDLNNDGLVDVVVASQNGNVVQVLNGAGTVTLGSPQTINVPGAAGVALADFNIDGKMDLVATSLTSNQVDVLLASSPGVYPTVSSYPISQAAVSVAVGDFNTDGKPDVVTNSGIVLLNTGNGTFGAPLPIGPFAGRVLVGDYNHDGHADILWNTSPLVIYFGSGTGTTAAALFPTQESVSVNLDIGYVFQGDINLDNNLDLLGLALDSVGVTFGRANGTFAAPTRYGPVANPGYQVAVDINSDGSEDLIVPYFLGDVTILLNNGNGTFTTEPSLTAGAPFAAQGADFDNDGAIDVLATSNANNVLLFHGNNNGTFGTSTSITVGLHPYVVIVADFNRDGNNDFATQNQSDISIALGNGTGGSQCNPLRYQRHLGGLLPMISTTMESPT